MATEEEKKPEGEAAPAESAAPVIVIKKVMDDGHGGAHGGAWKIALADMMTAKAIFQAPPWAPPWPSSMIFLMTMTGAADSAAGASPSGLFSPSVAITCLACRQRLRQSWVGCGG